MNKGDNGGWGEIIRYRSPIKGCPFRTLTQKILLRKTDILPSVFFFRSELTPVSPNLNPHKKNA